MSAKINTAKIKAIWPPIPPPLAEQKIAAENSHMTRIFIYSVMKIKAKFPPPYSTLNPDTSSDSPSAKSKGVRCVSAKIVTNQQENKEGTNKPDQEKRSSKGIEKL